MYCCILFLCHAAPALAQSTLIAVGYRDFQYGVIPGIPSSESTGGDPTGERSESKLWWNDGYWWGSLWDSVAVEYRIFRYEPGSPPEIMPEWVNTAVALDDRSRSRADILWDGTRLYVASHVFASIAGNVIPDSSARLYRYSYNSTTKTYTLDGGFPALINGSKSETLVIDKDSTGKLWITWVQDGKVKVNYSTTDDLTWGTPFDLPVQGSDVSSDDISSLLAFGGGKIGIMWSNQSQSAKRIYFAAHLDGNPDTEWEARETVIGNGSASMADDHINLKAACDGSGNIYAVIKTSLSLVNSQPSAPQVLVHKRSPSGAWSTHVFGTVEIGHTRPVLLIDRDNNDLYVFAVQESARDVIYLKKTALNDINFEPGLGTPFLESGTEAITDPTTTKQCVGVESGILLLANGHFSRFYYHNYVPLQQQKPVITSFSPTQGIQGTAVTLSGLNFTGATQVAFNGVPAASFTVVSDNEIETAVPVGAATGPVTVTNPAGSGTSADDFVVTGPAYTLTVNVSGLGNVELSPPGGTYVQGTPVTLTALPEAGYRFNAWSGSLSGSANPAAVTMDGNKTVTTAFTTTGGTTVTHQQTRTGGASNSTMVSTSMDLTAAAGHLYLAAISTRSHVPVSSVNGLGLAWSPVESRCSGRGMTGVEVWMAQGIPTGSGPVSAVFYGAPVNAVIAVSRYAGVDPSNPLGIIVTANTNGVDGGCFGGVDANSYSVNFTAAAPQAVIYGAVARRGNSHTAGSGFTERADFVQGDGGERAGVAVQDGPSSFPAPVLLAGSFSGAVDWAVIGIEIKPASPALTVNAKVFLEGPYQGPYQGSQMNTSLNSAQLLPLSQPFGGAPWNYGGAESVGSIPADVVDWMLVGVRHSPNAVEAASRAAFLKNDGSIVDLNGSSPVNISGQAAGDFYIVLYHRNHLGVMSAAAQFLGKASALYDFTADQGQAYGIESMKQLGSGVFGMIAGDGNGDGVVNLADKELIWRQQNGTPWSYQKLGDYNLDGGIDARDLNDFWRPNNGAASGAP